MNIYDSNNILCHKIIFYGYRTETDDSDPEDHFQVRRANLPVGTIVKKHSHVLAIPTIQASVVEMWYIVNGFADAAFYNTSGDWLDAVRLEKNDIVITYQGYHQLVALDNLEMIEIKNAPFTHIEKINATN